MGKREFEAWETHAQWWQDGFTDGADVEYEQQMLPIVRAAFADATHVLEIGTGEGQLARAVAAGGARVEGIDFSGAQLRTALARDGGVRYAQADAAALPFPDAHFDGLLACLIFEHVPNMEPVMREVARVLAPGGTFLLILNHPLMQAPGSGWIDDHILGEQYWRIGPYLPEDVRDEKLDEDVILPFVHRPISMYLNAMFANGMVVEGFDEPAPVEDYLTAAPQYADQAAFPRILVIRARR